MNILTFDYEYPPLGGGGGVVHALIAEELAKRHRVVVITSAFRNLPRHEVRAGVEIHRVPVVGRRQQSAASLISMLTYPTPAWAKAWQLLRRGKFDVINGHFAVPTGPGSLPVAKLAGIPHVLSLHGGDIFDPTKGLSPHRLPVVHSAVTWALRSSDIVVAQSTNTRANAYKYYQFDGPIEIIPLGIRQPEVPTATRADLGLPEGEFLAVTVGRLVKRKGIDDLLKALTHARCSGVHLIVVGDGPERDHLRRVSHELGLSSRVRFTGFADESAKWQILGCCNAYVSATRHEGFGLVYLEGMAAGLPVVTFDHGGQVDFLRDGETGYLIRQGDVGGLADAIARLAENPQLARDIGRANLARAPKHRIEECAGRYETLLEQLVNGAAH